MNHVVSASAPGRSMFARRRVVGVAALVVVASVVLVGASAGSAVASTTWTPTFSKTIPALPTVTGKILGSVTQSSRLAGRDGGWSAQLHGKSYWIFADTTLKNPWSFFSSSAAVTTDRHGYNGIKLLSGDARSTAPGTPTVLIPHTATETAFEKAHNAALTGCTPQTDEYCGVTFAYWAGMVVADTADDRILFTYGKLCRGGGTGTPCSGPLGKGLGSGVASLDPHTGLVTRLTERGRTSVGDSVEGADPTMIWGDGSDPIQSGQVVINGVIYTGGKQSARVPVSQINDLAAYRYWNGSSWVAGRANAVSTGPNDGSAGHSVFYSRAIHTWLNMYIPYGTDSVMYQVAGQPQGPWSAEHLAFHVPKGNGVTYGFAVHTEYSRHHGATEYATWFDQGSGGLGLVQVKIAKQP